MKNLFVIITLLLASCNQSKDKESEKIAIETTSPLVVMEELISDYNTWWSYQYYNISLSADFIALDIHSDEITKRLFLKQLTSGNYIPIEMQSKEKGKVYKLFELPNNVNKDISSTIENISIQAYSLYKLVGTQFPDFNFVDVNENKYDNKSLLGKTTVIKTWFIACQACVAEMPELNKFVKKYDNEDHIQFISLATDKKTPLLEFLFKIEFEYVVIPEQTELIQDKLNISAYPTHIVIDEKGIIKSVFDKGSDLISYIEKDEFLTTNKSEIIQ